MRREGRADMRIEVDPASPVPPYEQVRAQLARQIAGLADHHYSVEKREDRGRTVAELQELTGEMRSREIGRMLAGQRLTPEALKHAEQLIRFSTEV